jgi:hypothetical protein
MPITYGSSANLTVTALNGGIASSSNHLSGWSSAAIVNTAGDFEKFITAKFVAESSGLTAGEMMVRVYTRLDDGTWPDIFSSGTPGSEGAATLRDTEIRDALPLLWSQVTDTTASRVYPMIAKAISERFGGSVPYEFALFFSQNTGTTLETSGNQVTVKGHSV